MFGSKDTKDIAKVLGEMMEMAENGRVFCSALNLAL